MRDDSDWLPTRQSLLSRLRAWDDGESWARFHRDYGRLLFHYARKAGLSASEAEDVVQDTVISVAGELPEFRYDPARGSFKGWLHRIVRRRVADHLRRRPREQPVEEVAAVAEEGDSDTRWEKLWDAEWARQLTDRALERVKGEVSARQFQIYSLAVLQEQPLDTVCRTLGVNAGMVYLAKHRIGRLVRKELEKLRAEET